MHVHHQDYIRWIGAAVNSDGSGKWEQMRRCNSHSCPIDCEVGVWGKHTDYSCSKVSGAGRKIAICGTGELIQRRKVHIPAEFGGKACPTLEKSTPCNTHACEDVACHNKHVRCSISFSSYAPVGAACADPAGCHTCTDALECKTKKLVRLLKVTHDKGFSHIGGNFRCNAKAPGRVLGRHGTCQCKCTKHPLACFRKNRVLVNPLIHANVHIGVVNMSACSNLCTRHPNCTSWQYDSVKKCILHSGAVQYAANPNPEVTTWAGLTTRGDGCVVAHHTSTQNLLCAMNHYMEIDPGTDDQVCVHCPTETYSPADSIGLAACLPYSSNLHHNPVFNYGP
jgi:hypothetical protein